MRLNFSYAQILRMVATVVGINLFINMQPAFASTAMETSPGKILVKFLEMPVSDFVKLSAKDFANLSGKKLSLKEKISFSLLKKNMKRSLKRNTDQTVGDYLANAGDRKTNTALIIIVIVVVVVIVAVLIAGSIGPGPINWGG